MKGFMRQRGQAWELRVYLGADPVSGKQRYATRTVRTGKRDAQKALAAMVVAAERGESVRTSATVGELLAAWLEVAEPDFSPKTVRGTRGYIGRNLMPALGAVPLARLRSSDLDRYYRSLIKSGGVGGRPLEPGTVKRIHGILRRALNQGVKWGWLGVNPASATTPPRVGPSEITPPSSADLARVLRRAAAEAPELACFIMLAAVTGARRSELIALRWSDVDVTAGSVSIARGVVAGMQGLIEKDTKTHAARRVALDVRTVAVVADHLARMRERAAFFDLVLGADAFVFSNDVEGLSSWYPDSVSRSFKKLCRQEGLSGVRLHDLRHFVATQPLSAGVDVRTVAGRLGHRNASTTLNVYAHFLAESDRDAADVIGDVIEKGRQSEENSGD
jgi:integrase